MNNVQKAERIYSECFGHLDDTQFQAEKTQEIYEWLEEGDARGTIKALANAWRQYDNDPNIQ